MANRAGMPPPPPNHGFQQAPPGMVHGGPPMNRPQQAQQLRQPVYQQNFQQGAPVPAYRADTVINSSTRIHDIRPEKTESESFCKKQLTSYEVFTLLPSNDDDGKDSKGSKGKKDSKDKKKDNWSGWGGKDGKDGKDKDDSKSKKRERWAKVTINQECYPTEQIIKTIQKLDAGKLSTAEKKSKLFPNQSTQVTNILDDNIKNEREFNSFEWVLAQLHREESTNSKTGKKETTSMTVYLKRAPLPHIDVIQMYRGRQERVRLQAFQRQQQEQAQVFQQQQQQQAAMQQQEQQQPQQMGGGQYMPQNNKGVFQQQQQQQHQQHQQKGAPWAQPIKNKNAPGGVKIIQEHRPGTPHKSPKGKAAGTKVRMNDSDDYSSGSNSETESDYDSEFSHCDSEGTPHTSASSRSGGRKYPRSHRPLQRSRERRRSHYDRGDDFVMIGHPNRRRSLSYTPDVPRPDRPLGGARVGTYGHPSPGIASPGFDTNAFAMGVAAAIAQPAIIQQPAAQYAAPPPQRMISNVERAANDDARLREAEDIMRRDVLREVLARDNAARISRPYGRDFPIEGGRGYALPQRRYLDGDRGERLYRDPPISPSVSFMSSAPLSLPREPGRSGHYSPEPRRRGTEYDYPLHSGMRIPLEEDRGFDYPRNPFRPLRGPRPY
ncbi:hypothetical protein VC83_05728 [Pseudogymnoascus destructans]|uniref:Uncharacterized protein n=2 Tax=Pseudogymnoascus destructans TaxID=655981 RepID=L8G939_PSED2|nr:uncharacterized protein VC83_05728 [Pseudogymnoascus destructans]ELR09750.1 hypothetical protein GMDG_04236 [Pseudogymnoascus destructans 20631-21]OAF57758.1 hypothetical protein VC83_05728 [Pseudogymnoascus destructans]